MYLISLVLVIAVGFLLRATLWRTFGNESLLIELPPYQTPLLRIVGSHTWMRVRAFLRNAAGLILASVMCIWFLQAVPTSSHDKFAHVAPEHSLFAAASRVVAPVFAPAGFDDWRTASALVVGFVAKEAVISSWAQTYATEDVTNTPKTPGQLGERLKADFTRTSEGHLTAAVWAFLVFLLAYTPCIATLGAQRNEIGMRWTLFGLALQLVVAWSLAVVVFQVMRAL